MPSNAAVRFPEPDDFLPPEYPRPVPPGDEAEARTQGDPFLAPPGAVPPGAVASAELPWEEPRPWGIRPHRPGREHWWIVHLSAGLSCVLFLPQLVLLWIWLLAVAR